MNNRETSTFQLLTKLVIKNPGQPDKVIKVSEATTEELVAWINQAPDFQNRQERKQMMHGFMYSSGPQTFLEAMKARKQL